MTAQPAFDQPSSTDDAKPPRFQNWEFPEIAAVVVLGTVAIIAVGGLAAGISRTVQAQGPPNFDRQMIGSSITFGAQWANYLVATALLGVLGLCWWNLDRWEPDPADSPEPDDLIEAGGHINRGRQIVSWVMIALTVTAAGAIAGLVGIVMATAGLPGTVWAPDINTGASALAVVGIAFCGVLLGRQINNRFGALGGD